MVLKSGYSYGVDVKSKDVYVPYEEGVFMYLSKGVSRYQHSVYILLATKFH